MRDHHFSGGSDHVPQRHRVVETSSPRLTPAAGPGRVWSLMGQASPPTIAPSRRGGQTKSSCRHFYDCRGWIPSSLERHRVFPSLIRIAQGNQ